MDVSNILHFKTTQFSCTSEDSRGSPLLGWTNTTYHFRRDMAILPLKKWKLSMMLRVTKTFRLEPKTTRVWVFLIAYISLPETKQPIEKNPTQQAVKAAGGILRIKFSQTISSQRLWQVRPGCLGLCVSWFRGWDFSHSLIEEAKRICCFLQMFKKTQRLLTVSSFIFGVMFFFCNFNESHQCWHSFIETWFFVWLLLYRFIRRKMKAIVIQPFFPYLFQVRADEL